MLFPRTAATIKLLREERGWSKTILAARAFTTPAYIHMLETGKYQGSLKILNNIAKAFDLKLWRFIKLIEDGMEQFDPINHNEAIESDGF